MGENMCRQEVLVQAVRSIAHRPSSAFRECVRRDATLFRQTETQSRSKPPCLWASHQRGQDHRRCVAPENLLAAVDTQRFSILNTFVPHTGQTPWVAGLRFLSITRRGFFISLFFLHFMQ